MANTIGASAPMPAGARMPAPGVAVDPSDAARIAQAVAQLRTTEAGRQVADFLAANQVGVQVMPDAAFAQAHPGAGAIYDPKQHRITIPHRALASPALVTTLAHEGKHAMDFADRPAWPIQAISLLGGTAKDGGAALARLDNPVTGWLDSLTARQNEDEVTAYHLQARVAHELGRNESNWSLGQAADGTPLPVEEVRSNVANDPLYRMSPNQRLLLGGGLGVGAVSIAAFGAQAIAGKVRPGSYLAVHAWPAYAVAGALVGAFVVGDQLRARRLDGDTSRPLVMAL